MRFLTSFTLFALVGFLFAAPTTDDDKFVITDSFYVKEFIKYEAKNDIVDLLLPLNSFNFDENESSSSESNELDIKVTLFFVEAEIQPDGSKVYKGLYVLKDGKATLILENGKTSAASADNSKIVYFGADDGIYVYNAEKNTAEKYGSITDSIIDIAKSSEGEGLYILTEKGEIFEVTNNGEAKEQIKDVVDAKEFAIDSSNNIYFYSADKQPYVRTADGVKKIEGLPENPSSVKLLNPLIIIEDSATFISDNNVYIVYANGTSENTFIEFKPKAKPTAYAPEATLIQYYAYDKKIYEYNILALILTSVIEDLDKYLDSKADDIKNIQSNPKHKALKKKT